MTNTLTVLNRVMGGGTFLDPQISGLAAQLDTMTGGDGTAFAPAGFILELAADGLTAHAGGGQANALQIAAQTNRITVVATSGDSVKLPASAPGLEVTVINAGGSPMQVYGLGTDTINGVATATGVSQMQNSLVIYCCSAAGMWFTDGLGTGWAGSLMTESSADNITAHAGGGRASAVLLAASINRITVVATAADSVILPVSASGLSITVINAAASNGVQVFAQGTDTIDGTAGATGYLQAAGKTATYFCATAGSWHKQLSA